MKDYIQTLCESAGEYGCYFFCVVKLAEKITRKSFDPFEVLERAADFNFVHFNRTNLRDPNNFYMKNPAELLSFLTKKKFSVSKQTENYTVKENDHAVELWSNGKTEHFRLSDWDSIQDSQTVKTGRVIGYRIFREVK